MQNDIQDFLKAGNDILNSVSSAIDRNDYSTLHADVNKAIKSVTIDRKTMYASKMNGQAPLRAQAPRQKSYPFLQKKISRYLGVPQMALAGAFGAFMFMDFLES